MASNDDHLFAEHAVKGGFLTEPQVRESLAVQDRMAEMGIEESLCNVLVKRGVMREGDAALVARAAGLRSGREPIPGYTLRARVGAGAMGSVYRARQRAMKRDVAIKILRRDLTDDPRQVERLQREARLVGKLDHPSIVRGLDCGESEGLVYFVMEFVEGRTLYDRIKKDGPLPVDDAVTIARKMAEALRHAHKHGVVHRDVKPANILLTTDGEPRLTDYGLAKVESDDALTQLDATLGTPQYIAPEQARNPRDVDIRSDIYSLGATLYTMLAGRPPFQAETLAATLTKVLYERPQPLSEAAPEDLPPGVAYVVERMMAKDRRHRYPTPDDLVRDLRALETGRLHVPAGFSGDIEAFVETRRQRRVWVTGAVLVVAGVLAALGTGAWRDRQERTQVEAAARDDLADIRARPGERIEWDGSTVARMIDALDVHLEAYPDGATQAEARTALNTWLRQRDAIETVRPLQVRASASQDPDWPRLLGDLRAEVTRLARDSEADVALRRLRTIVTEVEQRRDRRAREVARAAREKVAGLSMLDAAAVFDGLQEQLRDAVYGQGPAPEADAADGLAADFRRAQRLLNRHFADYERAARGAEFLSANLRDLERQLLSAVFAADDDKSLVELLSGLPPTGERLDEIIERHDREQKRLRAASRERLHDARRETDVRVGDREFADTEAWLAEVGDRLLSADRDQIIALREEVAKKRVANERELARYVEDAERDFIERLGRRDYAEAVIALEGLEISTVGWAKGEGPSTWLVAQGRELVALVQARVWDALRRRLASGRPLERGLDVGTGIRYRDVRQTSVRGDRLTFSYGDGGEPLTAGVLDLALDDVLHYAGVQGRDPASALVAAALRIVETPENLPRLQPDQAQARMRAVAPLLEQARRAPGFEFIVERLADRRRAIVERAAKVLAEREAAALFLHEEAQRALADGRYAIAETKLKLLLSKRDFYRTEYVLARRDEIAAEHIRSREGGQTARYAKQLPGARLEERPDDEQGVATLVLDFEDPAADRAFRADPAATAVTTRRGIAADLPGAGGDQLALVENRAFTWTPWDGTSETHPSRFPFAMDIPFHGRRRAEVTFLYRSAAPFFLQISLGGTIAGILSAPDVREGGRGVAIWQAATLDGADSHFSVRHRSDYLARRPAVLEKSGATRFFAFEPGRLYRIRFVREERKALLFIDGRRVLQEDLRPGVSAGKLSGQVLIATHTSGEIDDVRVTGTLDPDWLKRRR